MQCGQIVGFVCCCTTNFGAAGLMICCSFFQMKNVSNSLSLCIGSGGLKWISITPMQRDPTEITQLVTL